MKLKTGLAIFGSVLFVGAAGTYLLADVMSEPTSPRVPASAPDNYESLKGCEKQTLLWERVQASVHKELPRLRKLGVFQLLAMSKQEVSIKGQHVSDFAPAGWKKYLHGRGAIAKVKVVPRSDRYTGIFRGAECALLRLSLTYRTSGDRPVAPGLAFKVLRDGTHSANISALVSLDGQAKDFNFFRHPMSNIVPIGHDIGQKLVHRIFRDASTYPEELMAEDMAQFDAQGVAASPIVAPRQIFFVPAEGLSFSSEDHDVRLDFLKIPAGTTIYHVRVAPASYQNFDYESYTPEQAPQILAASEEVADIVTTSEFLASDFGDDGIFFRHQLRP